ncbi:prenyltransferase/squalene oxidase repeat-containing protein [Cytobacillus sp. S13-E01]|uniref:terpene cyclase/mutase family protein n=1 Tax=Cytobacillus sp. S13-E01 TaxID=3031326 RepID=UPI0023D8B043|nr:prenyltransferase/squalene oxidase repeat-containing protein [Cytobacillus sp. S13-E01]MDF0725513.1 prenyltransferase/squalene oxidase repeat-containing protein [Cytobacillus sp. S13-E01]
MKKRIRNGMNQIIETLRKDQSPNGSWNYPFETGISTDCYMIILLRSLEINDENLIKQLSKRILYKQKKNGAWKLFEDEPVGNSTSTFEAYYALLYSGYYEKEDPRLKAAKKFIVENGGVEEIHMFAKMMLAMTGQHKWPAFFPVPIEMILLPTSFPVNFYSFSEFGRANLAPIMILADKKYSLKTEKSPDLSDLYSSREGQINDQVFDFRDLEWRSLYTDLKKGISSFIGLPNEIHKLATEHTKQYMLSRIEPDGTFFGYFSSTFLMIFALMSLGYSKSHPIITRAVKGLKSMKCEINGLPHMQYTTATVWNTSLINYALQEAGLSSSDVMVKTANRYLLSRQHYKFGDWVVHNPSGFPGGWGFADVNTIHPDVDDTTASLRSIARSVQIDSNFFQSWERGVLWVLSMQNNDGGWPAFEKNTNSKLLQLLPIEKAEFILTDPSSADLTGRTLEFFGKFTNLTKNHPSIKAGVNWLNKNQQKDGSWYGRWGICYIYGTWAAITGLRAVGELPTHSSISKAAKWIMGIQNDDGGWGESCKSDINNTYIPLKSSTLTHTAWALDALIATSDKPTEEINSGLNYLLENLEKEDWTTDYPKGQGMAGDFYIHYHSYRHIFPLVALSHYKNKFS